MQGHTSIVNQISPEFFSEALKKTRSTCKQNERWCVSRKHVHGQTLLYFQKITHYFVDFMCFIYVNYKDVFKVFLVHATRIVAPAKQSTVSEAKPSAEDER